MTGSPPLLVIAGPTATGKTGLALDLAAALESERRHAEIISADSRQVYRGLDIGTAKVAAADRARVTHHGLDLVDPDEPFSVADFAVHVAEVLPAIAARDGVAILVGGTGFYLRAIARGLDTEALPSDASVRVRLEDELETVGVGPLVDRLRRLAPGLAARVEGRNPRRVVRALEIAEIQGDRPLPTPRGYAGPVLWLGLDVEPSLHRRWIADRARAQVTAGLLDEARELRDRFETDLPAFSAIGYREAWAVLDGEMTTDQAIDEDARRNVAFAKRQRTWFRSEPDIRWIDAGRNPERASVEALKAWLTVPA